MRTIKELLQVMLDKQARFRGGLAGGLAGGLCWWARYLYGNEIITLDECELLHQYIKHNRPSPFSSFDAWKYRNSAFYWPKGKPKPRIKWLKKHIKKNS